MIDFDGDDPRGHGDEPSQLARDLPWAGGLVVVAGWGLVAAAAIGAFVRIFGG